MAKLFTMKMTDADWAAMDRLREAEGCATNADLIRTLLGSMAPVFVRVPADEQQWSKEAVAEMTSKPRPPLVINRLPPTVQYGPSDVKPGSRLKKR